VGAIHGGPVGCDEDPPRRRTTSEPADPAPGAGGDQQPSEEEVRQYLAQLRQAPAEQVIAEVLSGLLNAAQVKVGRKDGRLLLDLSAQVVDGAREHLSDELTNQVDEVLGQLRMAQVEGEREVAGTRSRGSRSTTTSVPRRPASSRARGSRRRRPRARRRRSPAVPAGWRPPLDARDLAR
jgi:hypothetical protein